MAYYEDIKKYENGITKCILCKINLTDSDIIIEEHIKDENHIQLFMQRLVYKNSITVNGDKINCNICNINLSDILEHVHSKIHVNKIEKVKNLVEKDGGYLLLPQKITNCGSTIYCLLCDRNIYFELGATKDHIESSLHRRARAMAVQPMNGIFSVEGTDEDLWCKICQVYFENYIETIFQHVDDDPEHAKKLRKLLNLIDGQHINIEKFLYDPKEDKGMCLKCGIGVPCTIDNLASHIKGKKHSS